MPAQKTQRHYGIANIFVLDDRPPRIPRVASIGGLHDDIAEKRIDWRKEPPASADATITTNFAMAVNLDFLMSEPLDISSIDQLWGLSTEYLLDGNIQHLGMVNHAEYTLFTPSAPAEHECDPYEEDPGDGDPDPELERFRFSYVITRDYEVAYDPKTVYRLPDETFFLNLIREARDVFGGGTSEYITLLGEAIGTNFFSAPREGDPLFYCRLLTVDVTDVRDF